MLAAPTRLKDLSMAIKVGFVGVGKAFDDVHFPILSKSKDYRITGVFDIVADRAESASRTADCRAFASYRGMLDSDEIDLVIVTTPSNTHAKYTIQALDAGKHVVVDKPPATTLADLRKMFAAAKRNGRMLIPFFNRRWDKDFVTVQKLLKMKRIGDLIYIESNVLDRSYGQYGIFKKWRLSKKYGGGILLDWGPHLIDQVLQLVQVPVHSVWADLRGVKWSEEVDDHCMLVLRFKNGVVAKVLISGDIGHANYRWFVCGERGVIWEEGAWDTPLYLRTLVGNKTKDTEIPYVRISWDEFYRLLEKTMKGEGKPPITRQEAIRVLRIIEAARKSARTGEAVRIRKW